MGKIMDFSRNYNELIDGLGSSHSMCEHDVSFYLLRSFICLNQTLSIKILYFSYKPLRLELQTIQCQVLYKSVKAMSYSL